MPHPLLRASRLRPVLVPLACLAAAAAPGAQVRRLNPPFELESLVGGVYDAALHPNGSQVLFRVSASLPGVLELHAAPITGGSSLAIVTLGADRSVEEYAFTPNGQWVVYVADAEHDDRSELFSHRVGTPGSTRISAPLVSQGDVHAFACAPSSARVVYLADAEADHRQELFSVGVGGGSPPVRLNDPLLSGQRVVSFRVAPAGGRVAFAQDSQENGDRLYSRALDGSGAPVLLTDNLLGGSFGGSISGDDEYAFTPNGTHVVFLERYENGRRLYSVPADGSAPATRLDVLPGAVAQEFRVSPDGEWVVYTGIDNGPGVFAAPLDGGPVRVLASGGDPTVWAVAPDSSRVVFASPAGEQVELRSAPLDGSAPSVLLDTLDAVASAEISAGSDRLVYTAAVPTTFMVVEPRELRSVPLAGGAPFVRLDAAGGAPHDFALSPDGARALYRWLDDDETSLGGAPLYSVPLDGSTAGELVHAGEVQWLAVVRGAADGSYAFSPDGADAVFVTLEAEASWLVAADAASGADARTLSGTLAHDTFADVGSGFNMRSFELYPGEPDALFSADLAVDQLFELFAADVAPGSGARSVVSGLDVDEFASTADGATVVLVSNGALYSAPRDGGAPPVQLTTGISPSFLEANVALALDGTRAAAVTSSGLLSLPLGGGAASVLDPDVSVASWPKVSPDSQWCVYLRREGSRHGLHVVPLAGGAPRVALTAPGENVSQSSVSFAGGDVLYSAGGLYRAALDGSTPRVLLSGATTASSAASLSPDGERVVFRARSSSPGGLELFSAPADGTGAPVRLSEPLPEDLQRVIHFEVTANSQSVAYVCEQAAPGTFELFVAPIDGSAAPLRLNAPLPPGGDACRSPAGAVIPFALDALENRVVYYADQEVDDRFELWVAALDGSSEPRRLSGDLVEGGDVGSQTDVNGSSFVLSPDSRGVVYCADQESDGRFDLYWVRLDGGPARRLNQPLAKPGCDGKFRLTADSQRVVYLATERSGVRELFSAPLERRPDAALPPFRRDR